MKKLIILFLLFPLMSFGQKIILQKYYGSDSASVLFENSAYQKSLTLLPNGTFNLNSSIKVRGITINDYTMPVYATDSIGDSAKVLTYIGGGATEWRQQQPIIFQDGQLWINAKDAIPHTFGFTTQDITIDTIFITAYNSVTDNEFLVDVVYGDRFSSPTYIIQNEAITRSNEVTRIVPNLTAIVPKGSIIWYQISSINTAAEFFYIQIYAH